LSVQVDRLVQNGWIAPEAPLPQPPTQHDGSVGGGLIVGGGEVAAQRGLDSQRGEEIPGAIRAMNNLRELAPIAGEIELRLAEQRQIGESCGFASSTPNKLRQRRC
jgi:hypothetical protein